MTFGADGVSRLWARCKCIFGFHDLGGGFRDRWKSGDVLFECVSCDAMFVFPPAPKDLTGVQWVVGRMVPSRELREIYRIAGLASPHSILTRRNVA